MDFPYVLPPNGHPATQNQYMEKNEKLTIIMPSHSIKKINEQKTNISSPLKPIMDIPPSLKKNNSEDANKEFNKTVMDEDPTADLTALPTEESTAKPTALPTEKPTEKPTALPTEEPTAPHETEKIKKTKIGEQKKPLGNPPKYQNGWDTETKNDNKTTTQNGAHSEFLVTVASFIYGDNEEMVNTRNEGNTCATLNAIVKNKRVQGFACGFAVGTSIMALAFGTRHFFFNEQLRNLMEPMETVEPTETETFTMPDHFQKYEDATSKNETNKICYDKLVEIVKSADSKGKPQGENKCPTAKNFNIQMFCCDFDNVHSNHRAYLNKLDPKYTKRIDQQSEEWWYVNEGIDGKKYRNEFEGLDLFARENMGTKLRIYDTVLTDHCFDLQQGWAPRDFDGSIGRWLTGIYKLHSAHYEKRWRGHHLSLSQDLDPVFKKFKEQYESEVCRDVLDQPDKIFPKLKHRLQKGKKKTVPLNLKKKEETQPKDLFTKLEEGKLFQNSNISK